MSTEKNIVIITYQHSVVVKGIEKKLKELKCQVSVVGDDTDKISDYTIGTSLFVIYLPSDIEDNLAEMNNMLALSELMEQAQQKLLLVGDKGSYDYVMKSIPAFEKHIWLDRPLNMDVLAQTVQNMLTNVEEKTRKKRILIVDDDPSYAKMVRQWIKEDYKVDIVTAGMQAISFLLKVSKDDQVDLILLDYEMPVVDGPQVLQMLRQEPVTEKIPVIFLTGVGTKEGVERVMALKPDGYILKSTTREQLLAYLKEKMG